MSLPIDVLIMIIEILRLEDAVELCHALHIPEQVAVQYCDIDNNWDDLYHIIHDIGLKPNFYKFLLKNKRFQIIAGSYYKKLVAFKTFDLEFIENCIEEFKLDLNEALSLAAWIGFTDVVKCLLADSRVDPSAWNNRALIYAARNGHTEIVKLLLSDSRVEPSAEDNEAFRVAAWSGHVEIVKLLLSDSRIEPSASNNRALRFAAWSGHTEVVKLLLSDSRVEISGEFINLLIFDAHLYPELLEFLKSSYSTFLET
jgi:hypothetical protein